MKRSHWVSVVKSCVQSVSVVSCLSCFQLLHRCLSFLVWQHRRVHLRLTMILRVDARSAMTQENTSHAVTRPRKKSKKWPTNLKRSQTHAKKKQKLTKMKKNQNSKKKTFVSKKKKFLAGKTLIWLFFFFFEKISFSLSWIFLWIFSLFDSFFCYLFSFLVGVFLVKKPFCLFCSFFYK